MDKMIRCNQCGHVAVEINGRCSLCKAAIIDRKPEAIERLRGSLLDAAGELSKLHAFLEEAEQKDLAGLYVSSNYWRTQIKKITTGFSRLCDAVNEAEKLSEGAADRHYLRMVKK